MISRELAEKLKIAGLRWEPKNGDTIIDNSSPRGVGVVVKVRKVDDRGFFEINYDHGFCLAIPGECTWLPSLSQLLGEIEKRGYSWGIAHYSKNNDYFCIIGADDKMIEDRDETRGGTPEEAAAQALLWVLKEGGSNA